MYTFNSPTICYFKTLPEYIKINNSFYLFCQEINGLRGRKII